MQDQDLLTEAAAINFTGVSGATLQRFAEAGYFRVQHEQEQVRFSRRELAKIFGLQAASPQATIQPLSKQIEIQVVPSNQQDRSPESEQTPTSISTSELKEGTQNVASPTSEQVEATPTANALLDNFERELTTQRNLAELYEKLLSLREAEIADLKEQREWLRSRVEKLEDKSSRDQILLLSETQIIRRMLTTSKRSPVTAALEWLGVKSPASNVEAHGKELIDVRQDK